MEAATVPAAPATTEPPAQQQVPQQAEPTQAAPATPAVPDPAAGEGDGDNAVLAALNGLREEVKGLQQQEPAEPAVDLLTALTQESEPDPQAQQEPVAPQQQPPQFEDPGAEASLAALQQMIDERAQQAVTPWVERQQARELQALQQEYPDITSPEVLPGLEAFVDQMVEQTGNRSLAMNPDFVRNAYKLVKAELAESSAVPAEQVAQNGASIETNAGQTQAGAPSEDEQIIQEYFGSPKADSLFTR